MYLLFGIVFWVLFAFTFFLMINQLMYQEHSIVHEWYKQAPGFHVLWIMMTFFAGVVAIALFILHHARDGLAVILMAMAWVFFFLMYNRMIEIDVQNKITAGDLPPDGVEMLKNISDAGRLDYPDHYPTA